VGGGGGGMELAAEIVCVVRGVGGGT